MRKSAAAVAPRDASHVPGSGTDSELHRLLNGGLVCFAETEIVKIEGYNIPFKYLLQAGEKRVHVAKVESRSFDEEDGLFLHCALWIDKEGNFYSTERRSNESGQKSVSGLIAEPKVTVALSGKQAMGWVAFRTCAWFEPMRRRLVAAVENPAFEFLPIVATGPKQKRRKGKNVKKIPARPFAVQLEMATALVEVIRKLDEHPMAVTLTDARRKVCQLQRAFKKAAI